MMGIHLYLWLLSIVTSCSGSGSGFNNKPTLKKESHNLDWMKLISDETLVSAISIPGTHESLSLHGGPLAKCQVWTLKDQLNVGIRYFNVHAGIWLSEQKHIYIQDSHWKFWQHIKLHEVLKTILDFLTDHSSETVLLKVKPHGFYKKKVEEMMKQLIEGFKDKIWSEPSVPNMQQARGKIVLLRSSTFYDGTENHKSYFFEHKELRNVERKIEHLKSHLCGHFVVVTGSKAAKHGSAKTLAQNVNKQLYDFVVQHAESSLNRGCLGVLSMNFPSADLIRSITKLNPCSCGEGGDRRRNGEMPQTTIEPPGPDSETTIEPTPETEPTTCLPDSETTCEPDTEPTTSEPPPVTEPTTSEPPPVPEPTTSEPPPVPEPTTSEPPPVPEPTTSEPPPVPEPTTSEPPPVPEPTTSEPPPVPEPTTSEPPPVPEPTTSEPPPVPEPTTSEPPPVPEPTTSEPPPPPVPKPTTSEPPPPVTEPTRPPWINPRATLPAAVPEPYPAVVPNIPLKPQHKPRPEWRRRNCNRG